ncbi:amino acid racemase [Listeria fleischmannii 1991]|uniref:Alanine racemase, N-terminal domain n=3 Tax=Listeria fleischmannii TaxID=1069827 RepID=A0A2X3GSA1_9LIST|nr:YhfX family PLP-dependent enzyme [Listeria fleischmannii]KMT61139.1 amino acid racemase [Listeria fleischmannii 1991]SQC65026.1 Alanine racemase, N-terminal domain [Listeria fleischmannii subsp. fleischmannii]
MFIEKLKKHNPALIHTAVKWHQSGKLLPDTYVIDLDMVIQNATFMIEEAKKRKIELFFMTKQIGRNPLIAQKLMELGFAGAVCVDVREALVMKEAGVKIAHVGHLVQVPTHLIPEIVSAEPSYMTVYTVDKAKEISRAASELGVKQKILIRVNRPDDFLYPSQYGGFYEEEWEETVKAILDLPHIELVGLTSFPCFLYQDEQKKIVPTHNVSTVKYAQKFIEEKFGIHLAELNLPSATCTGTLADIARYGGTQAEPGHSLTGTTPMHAKEDLVEKPAYLYLSEIAHTLGEESFAYGGGYYRRSGVSRALVGDVEHLQEVAVLKQDLESIDYHFTLGASFKVSQSVIMAFRTQMFVTRSEVAVVSGIQTEKPVIEGIYDSQGHFLRR